MSKLYTQLANWWLLISDPAEYTEEAAYFLQVLSPATSPGLSTMLELGSGSGNNALHMKTAFASVTLVDLSPQMLEVSKQINPDCEHLQGDMRTLRLDRTFDVVFVHDAIDYMTTLDALKQVFETAFVHCKPGGVALFVPDYVRETFESSTDYGGNDGEGRSVRYLEWSYDPDEHDMTYTTDYVFILREDNQPVRVEHDQHIGGLFSRDDWSRLLVETGFTVDYVIDPFERHVFIAHKANL
jgi:SAM-dependent methyltransferase